MSIQERDYMKATISPPDTPAQTEAGASAGAVIGAAAKPPHVDTARDHFESILFALVLALLFRTFEAEAFVIPTGSMAPTLYGRHKESHCEHCGYKITIGASDELDADQGVMRNNVRIDSAICPNCRGVNAVKDSLAFNGDRILVNKFPYELGGPARWDVFVFKYPERPHINYIKRLVGLPGETIRIRQGNLYLWNGTEEKILRKDDVEKQRVIQIPVYDDNHPPRDLVKAGWPERWAAVSQTGDPDGVAGWSSGESSWTHHPENRTFQCQGSQSKKLSWVRYRHFVPELTEWNELESEGERFARPSLVTDFCGYNTYSGTGREIDALSPEEIDTGEFWVGDLTWSGQVNVESVGEGARIVLELVEGQFTYQCRIDCHQSKATLVKITSDREIELATANVGLLSTGSYRLRFANVDDRLSLWIDDELVDFGKGASLDEPNALTRPLPGNSDLTPVGIAMQGLDATLSNLLVERDIYYRAEQPHRFEYQNFVQDLARVSHRPDDWTQRYLQEPQLDAMEIQVAKDGFLAFGDNSPRSADSRLWSHDLQSVPRHFLVGKAFFIYWPHGVPFLNEGRGFALMNHIDEQGRQVKDYPRYTVPFYPQIQRMKRIR